MKPDVTRQNTTRNAMSTKTRFSPQVFDEWIKYNVSGFNSKMKVEQLAES